MDEFDEVRLHRRRTFLESRATAHCFSETDQPWHRAAAATLLRDAAAVALMLGDFEGARASMRKSGDLFLDLGFAAGFQLLYLAGVLDNDDSTAGSRIDVFASAFDAYRRRDK